jgi:peptidoglycan LD-endopeptidase CwlK
LLRPDRGLTHSKHCFRSVNVRVQEEFAAVIGIWVLLFFFVACVVAWLVLFEEARDRVAAALSALFARVRGSRNATFGWLSQRSRRASTHARGLGGDIFAGFGLRPAISIVALLILMLPVVTILLLRRDVALEGFDANQRQRSSVLIEELLRGERLIPPPAPPVEVFLAPEVEAAVPMAATADRKWSQLDPEFTQRMLAVFQVMKVEYGYEMVLIEGYRSPQRQNQLAAKGSHVTLATAGRSWHQYGLAADCAFLRNGKIVISERDPWAMRGYQLYGQVAKEAGLVWGGDWKSIKDLMHVELRRPGVMRR